MKDFLTAYMDHIHARPITAYSKFSAPALSENGTRFTVTGYGIITGSYAMISGGGGCSGQDVCHSYIVKLVGPDNYGIEEVIACDSEYL